MRRFHGAGLQHSFPGHASGVPSFRSPACSIVRRETMPSRLSYLVVALGNAPRHPLRRGIILTLLLGWVVGVVLLPPPPEDRLVLWLSRMAVACSLVACVGVFLDALNLRRKYPLLTLAG